MTATAKASYSAIKRRAGAEIVDPRHRQPAIKSVDQLQGQQQQGEDRAAAFEHPDQRVVPGVAELPGRDDKGSRRHAVAVQQPVEAPRPRNVLQRGKPDAAEQRGIQNG